jgi:hypothetical protein
MLIATFLHPTEPRAYGMRFPNWVDDYEDDATRACARLRFLMTNIAHDLTGRGTLRQFAKLVDIDHSTLAYSVRRGECSEASAMKIEEKLGRKVAPNEYFRKPLEIN